jgi:hypothetical protein
MHFAHHGEFVQCLSPINLFSLQGFTVSNFMDKYPQATFPGVTRNG